MSILFKVLNLEKHTVFMFSDWKSRELVKFSDAPISFEELKNWLPLQKSKFGKDCGIEGIVWWLEEPIGKIKLKDFK